MLFALHYLTAHAPDTFYVQLNLGSMGSGIAGAIGLALADRSRPVVCIAGDGGMQMAGMEALVAVREKLPILFRNELTHIQLGEYRANRPTEFGKPAACGGVLRVLPSAAMIAARIGLRRMARAIVAKPRNAAVRPARVAFHFLYNALRFFQHVPCRRIHWRSKRTSAKQGAE
jgi:hypothetical protein